jgi:hypothetical protein
MRRYATRRCAAGRAGRSRDLENHSAIVAALCQSAGGGSPARRQGVYGVVDDSGHSSLHFKKLAANEALWSVWIGRQYRVLARRKGDLVVWVDRASFGIRPAGGVRNQECRRDEFLHRQHRLAAMLDLVPRRATGVQDGAQFRFFQFDLAAVNEPDPIDPLSFSSETPVLRSIPKDFPDCAPARGKVVPVRLMSRWGRAGARPSD